MKGYIILLAIVLCLIPIVSSASYGNFQVDECVTLTQTCANCTYINITGVVSPNSTIYLDETVMTKDGTQYTYSYCNTSQIGTYIVNMHGDVDGTDTVVAYDFKVTRIGSDLETSQSVVYIILFVIIIFLFLITFYGLSRIPNQDATDDFGRIMSVNSLKHVRPVLYCVLWVLLIGLVFTSSNMALAYLNNEMFGKFLFVIFQIMGWLTIPFLFIWFIYIFVQIFRDKEVKNMIERGIPVQKQL